MLDVALDARELIADGAQTGHKGIVAWGLRAGGADRRQNRGLLLEVREREARRRDGALGLVHPGLYVGAVLLDRAALLGDLVGGRLGKIHDGIGRRARLRAVRLRHELASGADRVGRVLEGLDRAPELPVAPIADSER